MLQKFIFLNFLGVSKNVPNKQKIFKHYWDFRSHLWVHQNHKDPLNYTQVLSLYFKGEGKHNNNSMRVRIKFDHKRAELSVTKQFLEHIVVWNFRMCEICTTVYGLVVFMVCFAFLRAGMSNDYLITHQHFCVQASTRLSKCEKRKCHTGNFVGIYWHGRNILENRNPFFRFWEFWAFYHFMGYMS